MRVDPAFRDYFDQRLKQVLLCITDVCNLHCDHCYYKTTLRDREMDLETTLSLLRIFRDYGADKLTILGGEPTLYGYRDENRPLFNVISEAKRLGYGFVRLDTNGQSSDYRILDHPDFRKLDNLSFSLEGHTSAINDLIRGEGTFSRCIQMLGKAVSLGYYVSVTTCVHTGNFSHIDEAIAFFTSLGIRELNFHPLFKMGVARDSFTGNAHIEPAAWLTEYERLRTNIDAGVYSIRLRVPRRFVTLEEYQRSPLAYEYCPVRMGERVWVQPDGHIRVCSLCFGSPYHIATYSQDEIVFAKDASEASVERLQRHPCLSQTRDFDGLKPLCISYKPFQDEYLWTRLRLDEQLFYGYDVRFDTGLSAG